MKVVQTNDDLSRSLGRLEGRLDAQDRLLVEIKSDVRSFAEYMHQNKGSWRLLVILGSLTSAIGAFAAEVVHWFRG